MKTLPPEIPPPFEESVFRVPPADFRSVPLWTWNTDMDEALIDRTLEGMQRAGMGGAFVHPRPGLITEYLGEEWFRLWGYALQKAVSLGLSLHVYDENSYPSGFAGGRVMEALPEAVSRSLHIESQTGAPPPHPVLATFTDRNGRAVDVTLRACGAMGWLAGKPFPDCSDPQVVAQFIKLTHEQYARRFRDELGRTIRCFFFDEPELNFDWGLPFSDSIAGWFRERRGYDFLEHLPVFYSDGPESRSVRHDYFLTLNEIWIGHFIKPLSVWAEANGVQITGHVMEHQWPFHFNGSAMSVYRWMQMPGIDLLGCQYRLADKAGNALYLLTVKELASVANQLGKPRTLCEIHGAGGADYGPENLKNLVDWAVVHGVNFLCEHYVTSSVTGSRKYDCPQFFNDFSPWFREYRSLADHQARLCYALSRGRQGNRILVLQPTTSAWLDHPLEKNEAPPGRGDRRPLLRLRASQSGFIQALTEHAVGFDLGDELVMAEFARAEADGFRIGECCYDAVVIPPATTNLLRTTWVLLAAWLEKGGRVLSGAGPELACLNGRENRSALQKLAAFPGWEEISGVDALCRRLAEIVPTVIGLPGRGRLPEQVYCHVRTLEDGGRIYLFVNSGLENVEFEAVIAGGHVRRLDTFTGESDSYPAVHGEAGLKIAVSLERTGHLLLLSGPEARPAAEASEPSVVSGRFFEFVTFETIRRENPNVLPLDYCNLRTDGEWRRDLYAPTASNLMWKAHGRNGSPWSEAVQFRRELLDARFGKNTGFDCEYEFDAGELDEMSLHGLDLAVERPGFHRITVNGAEVSFDEAETWMDSRIGRIRVGPLLRPGLNTVRLTCRPMNILAEIAPVYLLGEFSLEALVRGFRLAVAKPLKMGAWSSQGMPFYSDIVRYEASFETAEPFTHCRVELGRLRGSFGRIWIDGHLLGTAQFSPCVLSVPIPVEPGKHRLRIEVAGNWKNLIGPHFGESPEEIPLPPSWEKFSSPRPPGDRYRFNACGLADSGIRLAFTLR